MRPECETEVEKQDSFESAQQTRSGYEDMSGMPTDVVTVLKFDELEKKSNSHDGFLYRYRLRAMKEETAIDVYCPLSAFYFSDRLPRRESGEKRYPLQDRGG